MLAPVLHSEHVAELHQSLYQMRLCQVRSTHPPEERRGLVLSRGLPWGPQMQLVQHRRIKMLCPCWSTWSVGRPRYWTWERSDSSSCISQGTAALPAGWLGPSSWWRHPPIAGSVGYRRRTQRDPRKEPLVAKAGTCLALASIQDWSTGTGPHQASQGSPPYCGPDQWCGQDRWVACSTEAHETPAPCTAGMC